jgi:type VII secretion integral membrane protein EccD
VIPIAQPEVDLARVTVAAPRRHVDVVLPTRIPLAELLPSMLRHAGESLADDGEGHGGWVLRRADGAALDANRPLGGQVRDGETLFLKPSRVEWPEPDFDDLADAIAIGAGRHVAPWSARATHTYGLVAVGVVLAAGLVPVLASGEDRAVAGAAALAVAVVLGVLGTLLARAVADPSAGALLAALSLPYALTGGLLILAPAGALGQLTTGNLMLASAALVLASVLGWLGVAAAGGVFVAGTLAGLLGVAGALIAMVASPAGAAAALTALLAATIAGFPLLAMRLSKLPLPAVPQRAADLSAGVLPDRASLFAGVARADIILTGLVIGAAAVQVVSAALLLRGGGAGGVVLIAVASAVAVLRARLFVALRQRLPLLVAGTAGMLILGLSGLAAAPPQARLGYGLAGVAVVAATLLAATITYSRRTPSPYMQRAAEILDVTLMLLVVPTAFLVLGLFGWIRGLGG